MWSSLRTACTRCRYLHMCLRVCAALCYAVLRCNSQSKLLKSGDGKDVVVSGEEAAALRREAQEQEVLLRGYQQENEAAMKKIKVTRGWGKV